MPRERVKSVAATAAMACLAVAVAYPLLGTVAAALVALAVYGVAVFMLGLVNAGAAAAALMATLAVVVAIDPVLDDSDEQVPPERAQLREARTSLGASVEREGKARERQEQLEAELSQLRGKSRSSARRTGRQETQIRRLRRALRRANQ